MNSIVEYFAAPLRDLSAFALIQLQWLAVAMLGGKFIAVQHAYKGSALLEKLKILSVTAAYDLLTYAGLFVFIMLLSLIPLTHRVARVLLFLFIEILTIALILVAFANVEFFSSLGSPLNYHLLVISPDLAGYLALSGIANASGALGPAIGLVLAVLLLSPLLLKKLGPSLRAGESWRLSAKVLCVASMLVCVVSWSLPVDGFREIALRNLSIPTLLTASGAAEKTRLAPSTAAENAALKKLLGPDSTEGQQAFAAFPHKKYNVLIWVWESVGERYLNSHHVLGVANTPNLDAIAQKGCVQFKNCFVECPLTAQTGWALVSGISPPNSPVGFLLGELPPHPTMLPLLFQQAGYKTAHINTSEPRIWRLDRVLAACKFDLYADLGSINSLRKEAGDQPLLKRDTPYARHGWGVEDDALGAKLFEWLDAQPKGQPFFALTWNIETHHPYTWKSMPADLLNADPLDRYRAAVERSDKLFGEMYANLVKRGLDKDTVIVVMGDHGEGFGRAPWPNDQAHSMLVYEDDLHVPLLILNPALPKGQKPLTMQCTITDLYPTLTELCGLQTPAGLHGASLAQKFPAKPIYSRSIQMYPAAVRVGDYKLHLNAAGTRPDLYNWNFDPLEQNNRAELELDVANLLAGNLTRWLSERFESDEELKKNVKNIFKADEQLGPKMLPNHGPINAPPAD